MYQNVLLIVIECLIYFSVMTALLHFRRKIGLGLFICVLGVMHFLETYLAANLLLVLPFGLVAPASAPYFAGKLMMILALYIEEDASAVRQPIYGLLIGNFLVLILAITTGLHVGAGNVAVDSGFLSEMGSLMIWGTLLLYVDAIGIVLSYEKLRLMGLRIRTLRLLIAGAIWLTFDQIGFFGVLKWQYDVSAEAFWGGLLVKLGCVVLFGLLLGAYFRSKLYFRLRHPERGVGDLFQDLTFRERYESLLTYSGLDGLTGAFNRDRFDADMPELLAKAKKEGRTTCLAILDIDFFKKINDRHGHLAGDEVLKAFVKFFMAEGRSENTRFYRYGGEEFVLVSYGFRRGEAHEQLDALREELAAEVHTPDGASVTFSAGVAEQGVDGEDVVTLLETADMRLYTAKSSGRNKVC